METSKKIIIPFETKENGIYKFDYTIDKSFIETFVPDSTILSLSAKVCVTLHKMSNLNRLNINIDGQMSLPCDRCLDEVQIPITLDEEVFVNRGEQSESDEIDIITISENANDVDVSQYIYESIILSIPARVVHEETEDGESSCNAKMLEYLSQSQPNEESEEIDPRWAKLKELKDNK